MNESVISVEFQYIIPKVKFASHGTEVLNEERTQLNEERKWLKALTENEWQIMNFFYMEWTKTLSVMYVAIILFIVYISSRFQLNFFDIFKIFGLDFAIHNHPS